MRRTAKDDIDGGHYQAKYLGTIRDFGNEILGNVALPCSRSRREMQKDNQQVPLSWVMAARH